MDSSQIAPAIAALAALLSSIGTLRARSRAKNAEGIATAAAVLVEALRAQVDANHEQITGWQGVTGSIRRQLVLSMEETDKCHRARRRSDRELERLRAEVVDLHRRVDTAPERRSHPRRSDE